MHPDVIWGTCDQCGESTKRIHKDTKICGECVDDDRVAARESELLDRAERAEAAQAGAEELLRRERDMHRGMIEDRDRAHREAIGIAVGEWRKKAEALEADRPAGGTCAGCGFRVEGADLPAMITHILECANHPLRGALELARKAEIDRDNALAELEAERCDVGVASGTISRMSQERAALFRQLSDARRGCKRLREERDSHKHAACREILLEMLEESPEIWFGDKLERVHEAISNGAGGAPPSRVMELRRINFDLEGQLLDARELACRIEEVHARGRDRIVEGIQRINANFDHYESCPAYQYGCEPVIIWRPLCKCWLADVIDLLEFIDMIEVPSVLDRSDELMPPVVGVDLGEGESVTVYRCPSGATWNRRPRVGLPGPSVEEVRSALGGSGGVGSDQILRAVHELCERFGYGAVPQMANWIERVWRSPDWVDGKWFDPSPSGVNGLVSHWQDIAQRRLARIRQLKRALTEAGIAAPPSSGDAR